MRLNIFKPKKPRPRTHEGARASVITAEQALRRSVLSCMLWEGEFYEDGVQIAGRIHELVPQVDAEKVAALAVEARERMKLRHAPLLLVREMARHATHRGLVAETLARVIQRADELSEFVAIYWAGGRQPLSAQVKKGLAAAFCKFDEYALAKYDRAGAVRLRDVLFLCHARPADEAQAALWKRLADNELATPDTWEVALSAAGRGESAEGKREVAKREVWERLLAERKLGALALLRNLRNLQQAGVSEELVLAALAAMKTDRVLALPFSGCGARRLRSGSRLSSWRCSARSKARARTAGAVTRCCWSTSPAPWRRRSRSRSEMRRTDAAYGLAILLREIAEKVTIYTFSERSEAGAAASRNGTARCAGKSQPHQATYLGKALETVQAACREGYDRLVVITDEQSHDRVTAPAARAT